MRLMCGISAGATAKVAGVSTCGTIGSPGCNRCGAAEERQAHDTDRSHAAQLDGQDLRYNQHIQPGRHRRT
jgi:hypothetical protein